MNNYKYHPHDFGGFVHLTQEDQYFREEYDRFGHKHSVSDMSDNKSQVDSH